MSAAEKAAETAVNVVADAAEEVADQAVNFAEFTRQLNRTKVQFYLLGMTVGGLTGGLIAWRVAYSRAETKYSKIVDDEIEEMRRHYYEKGKALEAEAAKGNLDDIVSARGYGHPEAKKPPMVVKPPVPVMRRENEVTGKPEKEVEEEADEAPVRNIFSEAPAVEHEWDYHREYSRRSPDIPYVIHIDEREELDYQSQTLTYYEGDDVLCNERDEIVDPDERDNVVGEGNLDRFGHGSGDPVIVYVRNDRLELIYEVIRSPHKYAEEVHGFHHSGYGKNLERMRVRERDDQEE